MDKYVENTKKLQYNVFKRYDLWGSTENAKNQGEESLDDHHGRKIIRSLRADSKTSLSDITNRLNNFENINVCKKNNVEVYSKQGALSVLMQEENTNLGGKQEKMSHVVQGKTMVSI